MTRGYSKDVSNGWFVKRYGRAKIMTIPDFFCFGVRRINDSYKVRVIGSLLGKKWGLHSCLRVFGKPGDNSTDIKETQFSAKTTTVGIAASYNTRVMPPTATFPPQLCEDLTTALDGPSFNDGLRSASWTFCVIRLCEHSALSDSVLSRLPRKRYQKVPVSYSLTRTFQFVASFIVAWRKDSAHKGRKKAIRLGDSTKIFRGNPAERTRR